MRGPSTSIKVTIWYAGYEGQARKDGGEPGDYTFPGCPHWPWYRGWMKTDSRGQYSFQATYPYRYSARNIPHVHFRIQVGDQNPTLTQLYFKVILGGLKGIGVGRPSELFIKCEET